jgi:hypothetical protein
MMEDHLAERFRAAVADEPPLGFDTDDVVDRAARSGQHRAAVVAVGAAAATVLLAGVTVMQLVRGGGDAVGVGTAPTSEPKPTESCWSEPKPTQPTPPTPTGTENSPKPTEPTEPKPTKPSPTRPSAPEPTKPTEPAKPCVPEPAMFTGWKEVAEHLSTVSPQVLGDHLPGVDLTDVGWNAVGDDRCVASGYQIDGDGYKVVAMIVCHRNKAGLDLRDATDGDYGPMVSDTVREDGSHVRVYHFGDSSEIGAVAVAHHRTDGVIVHVSTAFKAVHGQDGPAVSEEQLTAIATDPRLTF